MSRQGNIDMGLSSRITNLPDPISSREPALARNVANLTPLAAGRIISNTVNQTAPGTVVLAANVCRLFPIEVRQECSISNMLLEVTVGSATFTRLALYACNGSGYPTTLVFDGNQDLDMAAIAIKTSALGGSKTVPPGFFLIALKGNSLATVRAVVPAAIPTFLGRSNAAGLAAICGYTVPFTFVANTPFPATFPTGLARTNQTNTNQPLVLLTHG